MYEACHTRKVVVVRTTMIMVNELPFSTGIVARMLVACTATHGGVSICVRVTNVICAATVCNYTCTK